MKTFIFFCLLFSSLASAEQIMNIHLKNGKISKFNINDIKKITYVSKKEIHNVALASKGAIATDNGSYTYGGDNQSSSRVIDGNEKTFWCGIEGNTPQTLNIIFRKKYNISRIRIAEAGGFIKNAKLYYFDGNEYVYFHTINKNKLNYKKSFSSVVTGRIKLVINNFSAPNSWSNKTVCVRSFEVFGN